MIFVIIFACLFVLGISVKFLSPVLYKTEYGAVHIQEHTDKFLMISSCLAFCCFTIASLVKMM